MVQLPATFELKAFPGIKMRVAQLLGENTSSLRADVPDRRRSDQLQLLLVHPATHCHQQEPERIQGFCHSDYYFGRPRFGISTTLHVPGFAASIAATICASIGLRRRQRALPTRQPQFCARQDSAGKVGFYPSSGALQIQRPRQLSEARHSSACPNPGLALPLRYGGREHERYRAACRGRRGSASAWYRNLKTPCGELQHCCHLFASHVKLLGDFIDSHAVFEVLKHDRNRHTSIFEHPCPAYFTGETFHRWTATSRERSQEFSLDKGYATAAIEGKPSSLRPGANWNGHTAKKTLNTESPVFGNHNCVLAPKR